jgi:5'(3')-deoxyribonucleotidase
MTNKIIWVDLDEVLSELLDHILEYNNNMIWKQAINRNEVTDYYVHRMDNVDINLEEAIDWFREPMFQDIWKNKIAVVKWSKEKLLELKNDWNKLIVLTARAENVMWNYTREWINTHFSEIFSDIIFADHFEEKHREKSEICIDEWISYMVEDNYDYANELAENWIKTYLIEKPWNNWQENYHENIIKVKSWNEIKKEDF